ncbi:MAG: DUF4442 domain-containing protein [Chitinophagales bacterium]|nr:DUF4442 domain-containing protein [Chitinophagales bacterium]
MPESWETKRMRWAFSLFPAYRGTGAKVTYIDASYQELRIKIPLSWRTRNYVGTIYGGSMYGAVDPMYMLMLMKILGKDYVVWDKAATIRFRRPGKHTLFATFVITDEDIAAIKAQIASQGETDYFFRLEIKDAEGKVNAEVDKTIYAASKTHYQQKLAQRKAKES